MKVQFTQNTETTVVNHIFHAYEEVWCLNQKDDKRLK
jgi:hypothetical protein